MTASLFNNNHDGANFQAQAVLAMVRYVMGDGIEASWDSEAKGYTANPYVHRFDNCREQGYVIYMRGQGGRGQINIAFYEHRNSDAIYVQVNNTLTLNAPTLDTMIEFMNDKYDCAFRAECGRVTQVADFIAESLKSFWNSTGAA